MKMFRLPKMGFWDGMVLVAAIVYILVTLAFNKHTPRTQEPVPPNPTVIPSTVPTVTLIPAPKPTLTATVTPARTPTIVPTGTSTPTPVTLPLYSLYLNLYFNHPFNPYMARADYWTISDEGVDFVASREGYSAVPYDDGGPGIGNCTIGYGHLLHRGPCNGSESLISISQYSAKQLLRRELDHCGTHVDKYVTVRITQRQYDVMAGLVCNTGYDHFARSEFLTLLNKGFYFEAAERLRTHAIHGVGGGSAPYPGLVRRRAQEAVLFLIPTR